MTAVRSAGALLLAAVWVLGGCAHPGPAHSGPAGAGTASAGSGSAGTASARSGSAPSTTPTVTFVGDSWTVGLGATDLRSYAVLTAEQLGWRSTRLGMSGSGYVRPGDGGPFAERIEEAAEGPPDAVVVQGSLNDQLADVDDVAVAARETLARLQEVTGPDTEVLVVGAPSCPGCEDGAISAINEVLAAAADAAGFPFVDPAEEVWVDPGDPDLWADPLHPDDDGYARMAARLTPLLRDLVEG